MMKYPIYRVEAKDHNNKFTLIDFRHTPEDAKNLSEQNSNYFVRIVDCRQNRKIVFRNYSLQELLDID